MTPAIFLSASVPDPRRDRKYHRTADVIAIRDSVRALVTVALPHIRIIWGGHPAITPLLRVVAEANGMTTADCVTLYQSNYFRGRMLKDNAAFERVVKVPAVKVDRQASLERMRKAMIGSEQFVAGIFIGGMEGVEEEYSLFRKEKPDAPAFPLASTGGAALLIYKRHRKNLPVELERDLAYPSLFRRLLQIPSP